MNMGFFKRRYTLLAPVGEATDNGGGSGNPSDGGSADLGTSTPPASANADSSASKHWADGNGVSAEFADIAKRYDTPDKLLKDFVNQQKLIGKKGLIRPAEDAPSEDWDKFYQQSGRPESADKYDLGIDDQSESAAWEGQIADIYKPIAHQLGLDPAHAKKGYELYKASVLAEHEKISSARTAAKDDCINTLKALHGNEFDKVMGAAVGVSRELGFYDALVKSDLSNNPDFIGLLADYAKMSGKEFAPGGGLGGDTKSTINSRIANLRQSPDYGKNTAAGREIEQQLTQLYVQRQKQR